MWQQGIWASSGFQEDVTPAGYPGFPSQAFHEFQSHSKGGGVQRSPISPGQHRILHVCSLRLGGRQVWGLEQPMVVLDDLGLRNMRTLGGWDTTTGQP
jgi:hypothetical protein